MKNEYRFVKKIGSKYVTLVGHRINTSMIARYYKETGKLLKDELVADFRKALNMALKKADILGELGD